MRIIAVAVVFALFLPFSALAQEGADRTHQQAEAADPAADEAGQPLPSVELPSELDRVLRDYETAWVAGDADGLAALFTEDGSVRSPAGWLRGRDAIRAKYENAGGPLRLRAVAYSVDETTGYIVGAYGYSAEATFEDRGVFVLALRRSSADEPWLIAADLDNSINR